MNIHKLQNLEYALRHLEKEGVSRLTPNDLNFISQIWHHYVDIN